MITCKETNKTYASKQELFTDLRTNKATLIAQKKMQTKEADSVVFQVVNDRGQAMKADTIDLTTVNLLKMDLVINTTNLMDSHSDVHLKSIWKKSVKEKKDLYLLQEHQMKFDKIITDKVKATVKEMSWGDLGYSYSGTTEALVFSVEVDKQRNPFMFEQYGKGYVKNHSVGMRYVTIELAMDSESRWDEEEKAVWDKYINEVANKEEAQAQGYFWAVSEAKIIEGSAVPVGSNQATPVLTMESKGAGSSTTPDNIEPGNTHSNEQNKFIYNSNLF